MTGFLHIDNSLLCHLAGVSVPDTLLCHHQGGGGGNCDQTFEGYGAGNAHTLSIYADDLTTRFQ